MSKHYLLQKTNGKLIKKTVKDWAREEQNKLKFLKYSFEKPYTTATTPTSEEVDTQLQREGCKREMFNGDYYCFNPIEISENDLFAGNYKNENVTNVKKNTNARTDKLDVEREKSSVSVSGTTGFDLIENIKLFVENNSVPLFKTIPNNPLIAVFDESGFFLSSAAQAEYDLIKDEPHLYIAFTKDDNRSTYIGKSFQKGGRWKRSHAYHLGTLAHHLNNTIRYDDQNHIHWIDAWMNTDSIKRSRNINTIDLKSEVYVAFIPFFIYSERHFHDLTKEEIRAINHRVESLLIQNFLNMNIGLLNTQGNNNINRINKSNDLPTNKSVEAPIEKLDWEKIKDKNKKKLLIIACSDSKATGGWDIPIPEKYYFNNPDIYNNLINDRLDRVAQYRDLITTAPNYFIKDRVGRGEVAADYFSEQLIKPLYLPAIERYTGRNFYKQSLFNLYIQKHKESNLHILIVSGFYGLLEFRDYIIDYHLEISRKPLWTRNNNTSIREAVNKYLQENEITDEMVFYSLSTDYRRALKPIPQWTNLFITKDWDRSANNANSARFLEEKFLPYL
jgi:hypothetical protein